MKRTRTVKLVVETNRRITFRRSGAAPARPCGLCAGPLLPLEAAVAVTGLSSRAIHLRVEAGEVHFAETPAGTLLVCPGSLGGGAGEAGRVIELSPVPKEDV